MAKAARSKYRPKQDDPRMTEPRPYNLADPAEVDRLHHELQGYMRVSLQDGTDTEGREQDLLRGMGQAFRQAVRKAPNFANKYGAPRTEGES